MAKRHGAEIQGPHLEVYDHLVKNKGWGAERALHFVRTRPFRLIIRYAAKLTRAWIIKHHNYCTRRPDGRVQVGVVGKSSLITI